MKPLARGHLLCVLGAGVLLFASACRDESKNIPVDSMPGIETSTGDLVEANVDFPDTLVETTTQKSITLTNRSSIDARILNARLGQSGPFSTNLSLPLILPRGETRVVEILFAPLIAGEQSDTLYLDTDSEKHPELKLGLAGRAIDGKCSIVLPDEKEDVIDFGSSATKTTFVKRFTIHNGSSLPWEVRLGALELGSGAFSLHDASQAEPFTVPAGDSVDVGVAFNPPSYENYQAFLPIMGPSWCNLSEISLVGKGVEYNLIFEQKVEFSYVNPGDTAVREFTLQNIGATPITISFEALQLVRPASTKIANYQPFWIASANGVELGAGETGLGLPLVVPADRSIVTYRLAFRPGHNPNHEVGEPDFLGITGIHEAALRLKTDDAKIASADIALHGVGGGPDIKTTPSAELNFNAVAIGSSLTKTLIISNVGTNVAGTNLDNLRFRDCVEKDCTAEKEKRPEIRLADGSPSPDFKLVAWPPEESGYTDSVGLEANKSLLLEVKFEPPGEASALGRKEAELHIYSNDPDESDYVLKLVGEAIQLDACDIAVSPAKVDFGFMEPTRTSPIHYFDIKNRASTRCLIYSIDFDEKTKALGVFKLVNGAEENFFIEGNETHKVALRFAPTAEKRFEGKTIIKLHRPRGPEEAVMQVGQGGKSCLAFTPQSIDFQTVKLGCIARARNVTLVNQCTGKSVVLKRIALLDSLDDHFRIVSQPPPNKMLSGGEQANISLVYQPAEIGDETTTVELQVVEDGGEPMSLFLPVGGKGRLDAQQTDRMQQDAQQQLDLLFVVDNSCSMTDYQQKLATNFQLFIAYAATQDIEYNIAAVSTDPGAGNGGSSGVIEGAFWPMSGKPTERIVKKSMPADQQKRLFAAMVSMGTGGSGTEWLIDPAVQALSAEMTREGAHNAGFLRDSASLNVVTISDTYDHAPHKLSQYEIFFQRLKPQGRFHYHGIIPVFFPGACAYDGGPDVGKDIRVKKIIADFHGEMGDICTQDWSETLSKLFKTVLAPRDAFELTAYPDLTKSIKVKVAGVELAETDGSEPVWRYDSTRSECGAIVFETARIPMPGAIVEITYDTACGSKI